MLTIRINNHKISEDYVAIQRPNGVFPFSGRHFIAIISICLFSIVCSIPAGNYIPLTFDASALISAMGRSATAKGSEQGYLQNDEKLAEASLEITAQGESLENYDDAVLSSEYFAANNEDTTDDTEDDLSEESPELIAGIPVYLRKRFEAGHKFVGTAPAADTANNAGSADTTAEYEILAAETEAAQAQTQSADEALLADANEEAAVNTYYFEIENNLSKDLSAEELNEEFLAEDATEEFSAEDEFAEKEFLAEAAASADDTAESVSITTAEDGTLEMMATADKTPESAAPAAAETSPAAAGSLSPQQDVAVEMLLSDAHAPAEVTPAESAPPAEQAPAPAISSYHWGDMLAGSILSDTYKPEPALQAPAGTVPSPEVAAFPWGDMLAGTVLSDTYKPEPALTPASPADTKGTADPAVMAFHWGDMLAGSVLSDSYKPENTPLPALAQNAKTPAAVEELAEVAEEEPYSPEPGIAVTKGTKNRPAGTWYTHTVDKGETISSIFKSLALPPVTLKKITRAARKNELKLARGSDLHFLIDRRGHVLELVKPLPGNRQVRFTRMNSRQNFKSVREMAGAHFMAPVDPSAFLAANEMPTAAKAATAALAAAKANKENAAKEKAGLAPEETETLTAATTEKAAELPATTPATPKFSANNRPRLIIASLQEKESFDKAAKRAGLTPSEIATIKKEIPAKKLNLAKLVPGDSFRVLFNGIGTKADINAVAITAKAGKISIYRHPDNRRFFEENSYKPTAGIFRRFPINGKIKVNSPFNPRRMHPLRRRIIPHWGVDFKVNVGTPVYAPADGIVNFAGYMRGGGYTVIVKHAGPYSTVYMHLSKLDVKKGQKVHVGQILAKSGNTGASTGAHLHYELRINGKAVDPLKAKLPSGGTPTMAKKQREHFKSTVSTLKADLYKDSLAMVVKK